ncbi:chitin synthase-domain-containing protein [Mycena galopus ATCC 62051]|nr:chitin synthase-domain-containing protein [Mycena galopus ATCC 62051]
MRKTMRRAYCKTVDYASRLPIIRTQAAWSIPHRRQRPATPIANVVSQRLTRPYRRRPALPMPAAPRGGRRYDCRPVLRQSSYFFHDPRQEAARRLRRDASRHGQGLRVQSVRDAFAFTVAPDDWKVLLSQRRRGINSTVHNLGELVFIEQLCGFCCFSMCFVVMIDLVSTLTLSVTVAYIPYLFYLVFGEHDQIQIISLVMIVAVYVSFYLPFYSFWRMDDFSL